MLEDTVPAHNARCNNISSGPASTSALHCKPPPFCVFQRNVSPVHWYMCTRLPSKSAAAAQMALPSNPLFAIEAVPFLSRFDAAVKAAGLEAKLSDPAFEGTIFVPVDLVRRRQLAAAGAPVAPSCVLQRAGSMQRARPNPKPNQPARRRRRRCGRRRRSTTSPPRSTPRWRRCWRTAPRSPRRSTITSCPAWPCCPSPL